MPLPAPPEASVAALRNGLRVVAIPLRHLHVGHALLLVRSGTRYERQADLGLSHFCEHMLFRGAGRFRTSTELAGAVEEAGGHLDAATYRDCVIFSTPYAPGQLGKVLQVVGSFVRAPAFRDIEVERRIVLEELRELEDEVGDEIDAESLCRGLLFEGHRLGRRIEGTQEQVRAFTRRDLRAFHRRCFGARNMVLAVAGPDSAEVVRRSASRHLGAVPAGAQLGLGEPPRPMRRGPRLRCVDRDGSQTEVRFGFRTPGERHAHAPALFLARRLLDDGVSSRLQSELIERRGLAYELWADLDLSPDLGVLEFGALVAHEKVVSTVRAMLRTTARLGMEGPTAEELRRTKRRARQAFEASIDQPSSLGEWVGRGVLFDLGHDIGQLLRRLLRVRREDVRAVLQEVVTAENLGLTAVGYTSRRTQRDLRRVMRTLGRAGAR